ncbi:MAG: rhodanese-like domain-containing protein [Rhizobiales bacterium]|nr:rhodanese-like domain-containing protein [Hyphomicrobiales bacterium]
MEPTMTHRALDEAEQICPTTTTRRLAEGAILVDVREKAETDRLALDVPNVIALPLGELEQRFTELPRDRDLVMVCQVGGRSLKATYFLMYQGFDRVANMEGGIVKWAAKGFPVKGDLSTLQGDEQGARSCCGAAQKMAEAACCDAAASGSGRCC